MKQPVQVFDGEGSEPFIGAWRFQVICEYHGVHHRKVVFEFLDSHSRSLLEGLQKEIESRKAFVLCKFVIKDGDEWFEMEQQLIRSVEFTKHSVTARWGQWGDDDA